MSVDQDASGTNVKSVASVDDATESVPATSVTVSHGWSPSAVHASTNTASATLPSSMRMLNAPYTTAFTHTSSVNCAFGTPLIVVSVHSTSNSGVAGISPVEKYHPYDAAATSSPASVDVVPTAKFMVLLSSPSDDVTNTAPVATPAGTVTVIASDDQPSAATVATAPS